MIAFPNGALPETVDHGRTGFLVEDVDAMAAAIGRAREIDAEHCRRIARERFSLDVMVARYLAVYERLSGRRRPPAVLEGVA